MILDLFVFLCFKSHLTPKPGLSCSDADTAFDPVNRDHLHDYGDQQVLPRTDSLSLLEKSALFLPIDYQGSLR